MAGDNDVTWRGQRREDGMENSMETPHSNGNGLSAALEPEVSIIDRLIWFTLYVDLDRLFTWAYVNLC